MNKPFFVLTNFFYHQQSLKYGNIALTPL